MAQFTWRGVSFQERNEGKGCSPQEALENDRGDVTRVYDVAWADRVNAVHALLGISQVVKNTANKYVISRLTPHPHAEWFIGLPIPAMPTPGLVIPNAKQGRNYLYATKCKVEGVGVATPNLLSVTDASGNSHRVPIFNKARITTIYESLPYDVEEDGRITQLTSGGPDESKWERYVTKIIRPTTEFQTIPAGGMKQVGGGNYIIDFGVAHSLGFFNVQATWHQVPEEGVPCKMINPDLNNVDCIEDIIGCVNETDFTVWGPGGANATAFNKATLLLLAAELKPYRGPFGNRIFDITYMFKHFGPGLSNDTGALNLSVRNFQKLYLVRTSAKPLTSGWYEATTTDVLAGATNFVAQSENFSIYNWRDFSQLFKPRGGG